MLERLTKTLDAIGKHTELYQAPDGTRVLVLPYGGRVLGLFAPDNDENFYWTNGALESIDSAKAFYSGEEWHNSGGDRTWLAPEVDIFLTNYPKLDAYFQQRSMDPGKYQVVKTDTGFKLINKLTVSLSRLKQDVDLEIVKSVGPAPNPLRNERNFDLSGVEYGGYTQYTSLSVVSEDSPARVGLWNLVQMPHGGELLVPTFGKTTPRIIFGDISGDDLIAGEGMLRYNMRADGGHKIAIRAVATTGRVGYLYERNGKWSLIVRSFVVNPSGEYIDVPWDDADDLGYSTQACNFKTETDSFSELEYHIPAVGAGTGRTKCDDQAQVWAFRGTLDKISRIADMLLGAKV